MATALVTGGHGGLGFEAARRLAGDWGTNLVLAGRSEERMAPAAEQLRCFGVDVRTVALDTSSLASVREAAGVCREMLRSGEIDSLDAVLCNAGARFGPHSYSVDGYERTFATNHLGHFLLVELLADEVADHGRVVVTASGTHDPDTIDGKLVGVAMEPDAHVLANDGRDGRKPSSTGKRYATSKLCNVMHAYELDRRLRRSGSTVGAIAFDPGSIPGTGLARDMPGFVQRLARSSILDRVSRRVGVTPGSVEFSGEALARLAVDPAFDDVSGRYFQSDDGRLLEKRSSAVSYDQQRALALWEDSTVLAHLTPDEKSALLQ